MLRTKTIFPLLIAAVVTVGCIEGLQPARERTGFISLPVFRDSAGNEFMRPIAAFYKYDGLTFTRYSTDTCFFAQYSSQAPTVAYLPTVDAGEVLVTEVSGQTDTLYVSTSLGLQVYQMLAGNVIVFTPGDTMEVTVPGATGGFPATTISVKTAEPFTFDTPDTAARGTPMPITWTAATAPGSRMRLSFRLASNSTVTTPDQQIFCDVADDGLYTMTAQYADIFRISAYEHRSWAATRVRATSLDLGNFATAHLVSVFERPLPLYIAPP